MSESESEYEESEEDYPPPIVIDNGTLTLKAGFAGDGLPNHFITKDTSISNAGNITSWDEIETIYENLFKTTLHINDPSEQTILFTESIFTPKKNKEKLTEIMFEKFNIAGIYVSQQSILGLYATGRTTGIVIDSGYEQTQIVPAYEGYVLPHASYKAKYGGKQCTDYLHKLLMKTQSENISENMNIASIKEKCCYIANNFDEECKKPMLDNNNLIEAYFRNIDNKYTCYTSIEIENVCKKYFGDVSDFVCLTKKYKLPDENIIEIRDEQFKCTEMIFNPHLININETSLPKLLYDGIMKCDIDIRRDLFENIVLSGGNTMFDGIEQRLYNEIQCLLSVKSIQYKVKIIAEENRKYKCWIGGSVLSSLSTFQEMWISLDEYWESGPSIISPRY
eukprot:324511_1